MDILLNVMAWGLLIAGVAVGIFGYRLETHISRSKSRKAKTGITTWHEPQKPVQGPINASQAEIIKSVNRYKKDFEVSIKYGPGFEKAVSEWLAKSGKVSDYELVKDEQLGEYYSKSC